MSDNKFILQLKGTQTPKSVVEIKNDKLVAPFVNVPNSSDAVGAIIQDKDSSVVVAKGADVWKLDGGSLVPATNLSGNGSDYTGEYAVSGNMLWVNSTYTFSDTKIFTPNTKWVLQLCGKNLNAGNGDIIDFSFIVKIGSTNIMTKTVTVSEQANFFCKRFVLDFSESIQTAIKAEKNTSLIVQLLCADATASAIIYNGMTVLTALQRRVDGDSVASDTATFNDLETRVDNIETELSETFVKIDGTSIMTAPLKFMAGSMRGAVGPYLNGLGFWKLDSQGNLTQIATISDSRFIPTTTNSIDIGRSANTWKDLYLGGKAYVGTINNGYDISVPAYTGTMVVAEWGKTVQEGQILSLDRTLQPVWKFASTYMSFSSDWRTDRTTIEFCGAVANDASAIAGNAYLGEVTFTDLPSGLANAEVVVEIMAGTDARDKVIVLRMTSGNQAPYQWQYTYWNDGSDTSGWIGFQPELPSQTGNSGKFLTTDGSDLSWATVDALPTQTGHAGEYLTTDGSSASWAAINAGSGYHPDLFDWKWADHELNDVQWLRADTFSWQSGSVYQAAFNELFYDIQISTYWYSGGGPAYTKSRTPAAGDAVYLNSDLTTQIGTVDSYDDVNDEITVSGDTYSYMSNTYVTPTTETVAGYSLSVYTGHSGRKIVSVSDETNVANIYTATGVAWYYIIDIPNKRFKLPRSKHEHYGDRPVVGNGMTLGLTDGTDNAGLQKGTDTWQGQTFGYNVYGQPVGSTSASWNHSNSKSWGVTTDSTKSGVISTPVEDTDQYKYLYFYVGEFTQEAIENTAGLNAELFNDKVDLDSSWGTPSSNYTDLTLGASGATYTAPADGYVVFAKVNGTSASRLAQLTNHSNGLRTISFAPYSTNPSMVFLPVKKGDVFSANYDSTGNTNVFRFIYSQKTN